MVGMSVKVNASNRFEWGKALQNFADWSCGSRPLSDTMLLHMSSLLASQVSEINKYSGSTCVPSEQSSTMKELPSYRMWWILVFGLARSWRCRYHDQCRWWQKQWLGGRCRHSSSSSHRQRYRMHKIRERQQIQVLKSWSWETEHSMHWYQFHFYVCSMLFWDKIVVTCL